MVFVIVGFTLMSFSLNTDRPTGPDQDRWLAPASAKNVKNPYSGKSSINAGKSIYKTRCIVCHGEKGKGDGPAGKARL